MKTTKQSSASRAEQLRQKRTQRSQQRVVRAASSARQTRSYQATTVLSRDAVMGRPILNRTTTPLRRRVSVPYNNGTELLLRNIPVVRPGWRLFSGILALFLGYMIIFLSNTPRLQVSELNIQGNQRVTISDISAVVDLVGKTSFTIDPQLARQQLIDSFVEFESVQVTILPPNQVILQVVERVPVIAWEYEDEKVLWFDSQGAMFPPRGEADGLLHIVSEGLPPTYQLKKESAGNKSARPEAVKSEGVVVGPGSLRNLRVEPIVLETAAKLSTMLPDGTKLAYSWSEGLGWQDGKWEVYVGLDLENMEAKMNVYQALVKRLDDQGIKPAYVSVQNPDSPYYRTE